MAVQLSIAVRSAILDQIEATIGIAPTLQIRTGLMPLDCLAPDSGILLCEIILPDDWMEGAVNGSKAKSGTWTTSAIIDGIIGHFRIKDSVGVCHFQGTSGDIFLDNVAIATGQTVTINRFNITGGNA